jgi:hypothetical protein
VPPRVKSNDPPPPNPGRLSCFVHRFLRARLAKNEVFRGVYCENQKVERNQVIMSVQKLCQIQSAVPFYFVKAGYK